MGQAACCANTTGPFLWLERVDALSLYGIANPSFNSKYMDSAAAF